MKRRILYLGIVLVVALAILIIERPDLLKSGDASFEPLISDYDPDRIQRIEIQQLLSGVQAKKADGAWVVADLSTPLRDELNRKENMPQSTTQWFAANTDVVERALRAFDDVQRGIVVSMKPENQATYQVSGPLGLNVRLFDTKGLIADIIIGKSSPDYSGNYVREANASDVLLVNKTLTGLFPTAVTDWRDRMIWSVEPKKIASVSVARPRDSYEIIRDGGNWIVRDRSVQILDEGKVAELIGQLSAMRAEGFAVKDDPRAAFKKPALTLGLKMKDGTSEVLEIAGRNNLGQAYARRTGDEQIYLVDSPDTRVPHHWRSLR